MRKIERDSQTVLSALQQYLNLKSSEAFKAAFALTGSLAWVKHVEL